MQWLRATRLGGYWLLVSIPYSNCTPAGLGCDTFQHGSICRLRSLHCAERAHDKGDLVAQQSALWRSLSIDLPLDQFAHMLLEQRNLKLSKVHLSTSDLDYALAHRKCTYSHY